MTEPDLHRDDSLMERFERHDLMRFRARDAVLSVGLVMLLLLLFAGGAVRKGADQVHPGVGRDVLKAIGGPAGWVSDQLPLSTLRADSTSWLSPDVKLAGGGFNDASSSSAGAVKVAAPGELKTLLVTGDSLSTPLDIEIARDLAGGPQVIRDPHLATGISNTSLVDWGQLSASQAANDHPDAVVMFIGANEGYPMAAPSGASVNCCGADWAGIYEARVHKVMENYLSGGVRRIYWLTVLTPRNPAAAKIEDLVNARVAHAAASFGGAVEIVDIQSTFTPGDAYRDAIDVDGQEKIVRQPDGIHLNEDGANIAADIVLAAVDGDFQY
jgi:lysophospholipase L1-like esterase